jgi:uncharacterized Zn finger protein (UPF0148 family)
MAEIVCPICGYRVAVVRTGPNSAKPEHDPSEFQRRCREGPFRYLTATGCSRLDEAEPRDACATVRRNGRSQRREHKDSLQICELILAGDPVVPVDLAFEVVLKHAAGFR